MALVPKSTVGRVVAGVWLLLCAGVLLSAWVQQDIDDMPVGVLWLMIILAMPVGFPIVMAAGLVTSAIHTHFGTTYQPFWDIVPSWIALTFAGYLQWFV